MLQRAEEHQSEEQEVQHGVHNFCSEKDWVKPENPLLLERLEWFKDQKLGFMMHWGPYSQLGVVESWALSDEDGDWSREGIDWEDNGEELKRQYFFSKADWHTPYYWAEGMERGQHMWRGPSYNPKEYPWLWEQFVKFTHDQIMELMTRYGRIDVLWLDAGWVKAGKGGQDIRLGEVVEKAREIQPWLLSADRTVGGPYENYVTPEQTIPEGPMDIPWESCITMGTSFSFRYEDQYKSTRQLVHLLLEIVSKGGNLALNVGPQPDGRLPEGAVVRIKELGAWMKTYGEAVYGTRICSPYFKEKCAFTSKGDTVYCSYLYTSADSPVSEHVSIPYSQPVASIELVGTGERLAYTRSDEGLSVTLPQSELHNQAPIAHVFRIRAVE
jgi:alpha-L-fucosidase